MTNMQNKHNNVMNHVFANLQRLGDVYLLTVNRVQKPNTDKAILLTTSKQDYAYAERNVSSSGKKVTITDGNI